MSRLPTLIRMALHELWISYRLLLLLMLPLLGGLAVGVVPAELAGVRVVDGAARWFALFLCAAVGLASAVAAGTVAAERGRGTIAWMAVRAVPRSAVLLAWFVALAMILLLGIVLGAWGAWLAAIGGLSESPDAGPFIAATGAAAATSLAVLAASMLVGSLALAPGPAALLAMLLGAGSMAAAVLGPLGAVPLPTAGLGLLADLSGSARPVGDAVLSAGTALAAAAALLVLAAAALERRDL